MYQAGTGPAIYHRMHCKFQILNLLLDQLALAAPHHFPEKDRPEGRSPGGIGQGMFPETSCKVLGLEVPSTVQESLAVQVKAPVKAQTSQNNLGQNGHVDNHLVKFQGQGLRVLLMDLASLVDLELFLGMELVATLMLQGGTGLATNQEKDHAALEWFQSLSHPALVAQVVFQERGLQVKRMDPALTGHDRNRLTALQVQD
jgi:hypothetical protein